MSYSVDASEQVGGCSDLTSSLCRSHRHKHTHTHTHLQNVHHSTHTRIHTKHTTERRAPTGVPSTPQWRLFRPFRFFFFFFFFFFSSSFFLLSSSLASSSSLCRLSSSMCSGRMLLRLFKTFPNWSTVEQVSACIHVQLHVDSKHVHV